MDVATLIRRMAAERGYGRSIQDALVGIAHHESGLNPRSLGDSGTSYGLFQLHRGGGTLGRISHQQATAYWDPRRNINFTLDALQRNKLVSNRMTTAQAVDAISRRFERPADPSGEIASALAFLRGGGAGGPVVGSTQGGTSGIDVAPAGGSTDVDPARAAAIAGAKANTKLLHLPYIKLPDIGGTIPFSAEVDGGHQQAPPPSQVGSAVAQAAKHFLGIQYTWGGNTPSSGFDCSGLTKYVMAKFGVSIPRVAADQFNAGHAVNQASARPGDLIFFRHGDGVVGHVGIYLGGGKFLHAPHTGDVVKISNLAGYGLPIAGFRRFAR